MALESLQAIYARGINRVPIWLLGLLGLVLYFTDLWWNFKFSKKQNG